MMVRLLPLVLLVACQPTTDTGDAPKDTNVDCENTVFFADADGDGYGDTNTPIEACELPSGASENDADCDDADASAFPGGTETCDGVDNDCDGSVDNDAVDPITWFPDADGDGYGEIDAGVSSCTPEGDYSLTGTDCDDTNADIHPSQLEDCNDIDDDCDGQIDEAEGAPAHWYDDGDGDGYGDDDTEVIACDAPSGMIGQGGDCDDGDDSINPDATEVCDGIDQDCTGEADDYAIDRQQYYEDLDGDGFGDPDADILACEPTAGVVEDSSDCDDTDRDINPDGVEVCNGQDDDCDGPVDEGAVDIGTWHLDLDGDGYGDGSTTLTACTAPGGTVADGTDCNDRSKTTYPGAAETCNDADDDCDDTIDEDATDTVAWYNDADGDGYGGGAVLTTACDGPSGSVADGSDCDDGSSAVNPAAVEVCDGADNDCSGAADDDAVDATVYYADADGDGYGNASSTTGACADAAGWVRDATDCDDVVATTFPGADELCDGTDDDCDGFVDESPVDAVVWYLDGDLDGYGDDATAYVACEGGSGSVETGGDCADADPLVNPGGTEICNGLDDDCDDVTDLDAIDRYTGFSDRDGDGYGDPASPLSACVPLVDAVDDDTDCDDTLASVNPAGTEVCDRHDNDCDGAVDSDDADLVDQEGSITTDTTWDAAGSPYCLTGDLTIEAGAKLSIDPSVDVLGWGNSILVEGTLDVNGAASMMVLLDDVVVVPASTDSTNRFTIDVAYGDIEGGSFFADPGMTVFGKLTLTDSLVLDVAEPVAVVYPDQPVLIARNLFVESAPLTVATDGEGVTVTNNAFIKPADGVAIEVDDAPSGLSIHRNSFLLTSGFGLAFVGGYTGADLDVTNNYWNTTDLVTIGGLVYDVADDGSISAAFDYDPALSTPDAAVPDVSAYWP